MNDWTGDGNEPNSPVLALISTALKQDHLSGLSEMLKSIAEAVDAYGCILWRITPGSEKLNKNLSNRQLFVLAQWLKDDRSFALHNLPLDSVTGRAVSNWECMNVGDIWEDERVYTAHPFLSQAGIKRMCSVPILFLDDVRGAVNLYRTDLLPFTDKEVKQLKEMALLIPALYQAIQDKVSLSLIRSINEDLQTAELSARDSPLTREQVEEVFQTVRDRVARTFQCVETSIFLENRLEAPDQYQVIATTWQGRFKKTSYQRSIKEGLTGWVLAKARPVRIFDLAHFKSDRQSIRNKYPKITWKDSLRFKQVMRRVLNVESDDQLPPLSFMAAPIVMGGKVLGVIRCCTATKGPYFFSSSELSLLELVAAQIGHYWNNWLSRHEMQQENESWRSLVHSVSRLNRFVHNELTQEKPNEIRIFDEALRVISKVIVGAEIMDVRLLDEDTNELYFATTHGKAWDEGDEEEIQAYKKRRFTVSGKPQSAGAYVFQTGQLHVIHDVHKAAYYSETFPSTKRLIVAPISVEEEKFGVLDIRGTGECDFPKHAEAIAELLGQQLGLYHFLATTIGRLRKAEADLKNNIDELKRLHTRQVQTFEDFEHQLKSPIIQAHARTQSVLKDALPDEKLRPNLQAIRGLCGKAKRVTLSTGLYAKLAVGASINLNLKRLYPDYLIKMLIEAAADNELMNDPNRDITFHVERKTPDVFRTMKISADYDLLEQAVNNLLDNAGKYSYAKTRVEIYWGLTGKERFHISIINKGLPIRPGDVKACVKRGWRSGLAEATTGEGSGIGLWIVDHIMKAHDGELIIVPTAPTGLTEVKLVFPSSKN